MARLKSCVPCAFCGNDKIEVKLSFEAEANFAYCKCLQCEARGPRLRRSINEQKTDPGGCIAAWNAAEIRPLPSKLKRERAREQKHLHIVRSFMPVDTAPGTKVIFEFPKNGSDFDRIKAASLFIKKGDVFTVHHTEPEQYHTRLYLEEFPGVIFNTVNFALKD